MDRDPDSASIFPGFERPEANFFRMPNSWTDITARITNLAELKVVEYILRHTWGFQEYGTYKHITVDEFVRGRRRQDGSRMDMGTGLSERAVRYGLRDAVHHGFIDETTDASDLGRIKKSYGLRMRPSDTPQAGEAPTRAGVQTLHPDLHALPPRGAAITPRTEKDTQERYFPSSNAQGKNSHTPAAAPTRGSSSLTHNRPHDSRPTATGAGGQDAPSAHGPGRTAPTGFTRVASILPRGVQAPAAIAPHGRGEARRAVFSDTHDSEDLLRLRRRSAGPLAPQTHEIRPHSPSSGTAYLDEVIRQLTRTDLADDVHLASNQVRARNLLAASGLDEVSFVQHYVYPAKSAMKAAPRVTRPGAYFFACLERLLHDATTQPAPDAASDAEQDDQSAA